MDNNKIPRKRKYTTIEDHVEVNRENLRVRSRAKTQFKKQFMEEGGWL